MLQQLFRLMLPAIAVAGVLTFLGALAVGVASALALAGPKAEPTRTALLAHCISGSDSIAQRAAPAPGRHAVCYAAIVPDGEALD